MGGIRNTTQKTLTRKVTVFLCVFISLFLLSAVFAYADSHTGITASIKTLIFETAISVGGFVAGLGGILLDITITELVLKMGAWFRYGGIGGVVTDMWTMIRDIFNILFIFSLVYIGLRTILDSDDSRTKKMLGMLIAAALLINFSLYIAKVIVDISNFTAVEIHKMATDGIDGQFGITTKEGGVNFTTDMRSISGAYMEVLGVSSWFDNNLGTAPNTIAYSLFAMIFLMFLGFVLAYGAIMLVARFIAIIFYLIFSPFMFLGWVLPQFQSYATKWWKGFLGYSFFAPVYILMLYMGLYALQQITNGFGKMESFSTGFTTGQSFSPSTFQIFLLFAIGTGFLIAATKVAGILSQGGAAIGMNMADKFSRRVVGRATNTAVGAGANWVGNRMDASRAKKDKPRGRTGRALRSFVESGTTAKFGANTSRKDRVDADKAEARKHSTTHGAYETQQKIMSGDTSEREAAIAGASDSTLIEMAKTKKGRAALIQSAGSLKESQVQAILKSEDVTPETKGELKGARKKSVIRKIKGSDKGHLKDGLKDASTTQLTSIDFKDDLMSNAMYLQESQMDDLKKKWDDNETFRMLKEEREEQLKKAPIPEIIRSRKNPKEIAKLPNTILENSNTMQYLKDSKETPLSADMLKTFARESKSDKRKLGQNVLKAYGSYDSLPPDIQNYFKGGDGVIYGIHPGSKISKSTSSSNQTSGFNNVKKSSKPDTFWKNRKV